MLVQLGPCGPLYEEDDPHGSQGHCPAADGDCPVSGWRSEASRLGSRPASLVTVMGSFMRRVVEGLLHHVPEGAAYGQYYGQWPHNNELLYGAMSTDPAIFLKRPRRVASARHAHDVYYRAWHLIKYSASACTS